MRFRTPVWSLELAPEWRAEDRGDHVAVLNDDPDTMLRLTTFELTHGLTAAKWIEMVGRFHPPRGRPVKEVRCGGFRGIRTEFAVMDPGAPPTRDDRWLRAWTLECGGTPLDITYTCPLWCAGRDDADVRGMLASLRAGPRIRPEP
jgi:hypothetical protein